MGVLADQLQPLQKSLQNPVAKDWHISKKKPSNPAKTVYLGAFAMTTHGISASLHWSVVSTLHKHVSQLECCYAPPGGRWLTNSDSWCVSHESNVFENGPTPLRPNTGKPTQCSGHSPQKPTATSTTKILQWNPRENWRKPLWFNHEIIKYSLGVSMGKLCTCSLDIPLSH